MGLKRLPLERDLGGTQSECWGDLRAVGISVGPSGEGFMGRKDGPQHWLLLWTLSFSPLPEP